MASNESGGAVGAAKAMKQSLANLLLTSGTFLFFSENCYEWSGLFKFPKSALIYRTDFPVKHFLGLAPFGVYS